MLLQWGHAFVSVETRRVTKLPRPIPMLQWGHAFVSVETWLRPTITVSPAPLQWGHAFVSVETPHRRKCGYCFHVASMGPRFCKRGNDRSGLVFQQTESASMGPRFCKRGNLGQPEREVGTDAMLQWGHAFVSVETRPSRRRTGQRRDASMGPRFCKRGNGAEGAMGTREMIASMGPRFCKRGNHVRCAAV